ncbi:MAG: hypothetical protein IPL90_05980 [Holophagales bacterium]|nr:hypothetical protein [Holophagales bacterium]
MPPGLGEVLAESGDLTLRRLRKASDWRRLHGGTIDRALLATGAVSEETLLDALERVTGLPSISRERLAAARREAVETLPADARRRLRALPFDRRGNVLYVAVVDPGNPVLETGLVASTGCAIHLHVTADPILEDVLRAWESPGTKADRAPAPPASPARPAPSAPAPLPARNRNDPAIELDPFARLARALLVDAIDEGAQAVEIGPEGKGALLRTYSGGVAQTSRPLPLPVLEPLFAWFLARTRPSGPFDEGGLVLERSGRRVRVEATVDATGTAWLVLEPAPRSPMAEHEICLHDDAVKGDVFCPSCGALL